MIKNISLFKNIANVKRLIDMRRCSLLQGVDCSKLSGLKRDVFQSTLKTEAPEVLKDDPPIIIGKFHFDYEDERFKIFWTQYRAYLFEGYDNIFPNSYVCIDKKGERRLKPHVYLDLVKVKPEFARQGAYKEAVKQLVEAAKEECGGRVILDSMKLEQPDMADIPSPAVAHWKAGFRYANDANNKIAEKIFRENLPLEGLPNGTMYYADI